MAICLYAIVCFVATATLTSADIIPRSLLFDDAKYSVRRAQISGYKRARAAQDGDGESRWLDDSIRRCKRVRHQQRLYALRRLLDGAAGDVRNDEAYFRIVRTGVWVWKNAFI